MILLVHPKEWTPAQIDQGKNKVAADHPGATVISSREDFTERGRWEGGFDRWPYGVVRRSDPYGRAVYNKFVFVLPLGPVSTRIYAEVQRAGRAYEVRDAAWISPSGEVEPAE